MAHGSEDLTIRRLQEIGREQEDFRTEVQERFKDLTQRVDGNTLLLNLVAGVVHDHEQRLEQLERPKR